MQQTITVKEKSVYGKILIYPACENATIFADLVGAKTFSTYHLNLIEKLGYTINQISLP